METRPGYKVHTIIVTSCHGNDGEAWSISCLIIQHKPYIVSSHQRVSSKATITTQKYASWHRSAKLQDIYVQYMRGIGKSHLNSVLNVTLVHVPHWSGVVPPWSVMVLH